MDEKKILQNVSKLNYVLHKAANESAYKKELLQHPKEVLAKEGVDLEKKKVTCYENTGKDFHIIVPVRPIEEKMRLSVISKGATLEQIMRFIITQVQTNSPLKAKLLSSANEVLKEKGVKLPEGLKINVHQSTADAGYLVIPRVPTDDTELNDLEMQAFAGGKDQGRPAGGSGRYSQGLTTGVSPSVGGEERHDKPCF